jgi:ubiquinone/menaquinone biosynthesis C-methylase UbiE
VLDLGCGPGTITLGLAHEVLPGRVTGVDASPSCVESAQRRAAGMEMVNVSFRTANAGELPFEDGSFDLVFSHDLLGTVPRPHEVLTEIHRVLRPGGWAALACMDWENPRIGPASAEVEAAWQAYRTSHNRRRACPEAGARLADWAMDAGLALVHQARTYESHENLGELADRFADRLEQAGVLHHAVIWRRWGSDKKATFDRAWDHVIARKPESNAGSAYLVASKVNDTVGVGG